MDKPRIEVMRNDPTLQAAWDRLPVPLRDCGEIAGARLSSLFSDALRQAEEQLYSECAQALTRVEREALLDAAEFARVRRESLVADFRLHFENRYVRACQYQPTVISGYRIDFDPSQLKIVEHSLLDDSLRPGLIVEAIQHASWNTLNALTICFGKMLGNTAIKPNEIPLSPKLIEAALTDALREQPWRHDAKYRLVGGLRKVLAPGVNQLYRDLAEHFHRSARQPAQAKTDVSTPPPVQVDRLPQEPQTELEAAELEAEIEAALTNVPPDSEATGIVEAEAAGEDTHIQDETPVQQDLETASHTQDLQIPLPETAGTAGYGVEPSSIEQTDSETVGEEVGTAQSGEVLAAIERGTWLEFREAGGNIKDLKLSWVSPGKSLYLMIDRHGARALSISAEDLAAALLDGRVRVVDSPR